MKKIKFKYRDIIESSELSVEERRKVQGGYKDNYAAERHCKYVLKGIWNCGYCYDKNEDFEWTDCEE